MANYPRVCEIHRICPVKWLVVVVALWIAITGASPRSAYADDVVVSFTAVISHVSYYPWCICRPDTALFPGDTLVGYYVYDSAASDTDPSPRTGRYTNSSGTYGIVVYHKNYTFSSDWTDPLLRLVVVDSTGDGGELVDDDRYTVDSDHNKDDPFQGVSKGNIMSIDMYLTDGSGLAVANDSLPKSPPDLSDWSTEHILVVYGGEFNWGMEAELTAISQGVPSTGGITPSTQVLALTGYPNPFNPAITLVYEAPMGTDLSLRVYDVRGRVVRSLVQDSGSNDHQRVIWDGRNDRGTAVSSGVYFAVLRAGKAVVTRKLALVR